MKDKRQRAVTAAVVVVSVAGILYFGARAIRESSSRNRPNPFEYDLERFKESGAGLVRYAETGGIRVERANVTAIAVGPDDRLYVAGDDAVLIFDTCGAVEATIAVETPAGCLAVDKNGDLYLGLGNHVEVRRGGGGAKSDWESPGEKAILTSIALSSARVFVADAGSRVVWEYDKSGRRVNKIGAKDESRDIPGFIIPSPFFDVAVDPDGFLWAANPGRHLLQNFTPDGNIRTSWGKSSMKVEGFGGCCNPTHFAVLEDGSFVTSEKGLARVKVYDRLGDLVSVVAAPDAFDPGTVGLDLAVDASQRIYVLDPRRKMVRIFEKQTPRQGESR